MFGNIFEADDLYSGSLNRTRPSLSSWLGSIRRAGEFVGLDNQGATCYLNSLLQTMFMTPELREGLFKLDLCELGMRPEDVASAQDVDVQNIRVMADPGPSAHNCVSSWIAEQNRVSSPSRVTVEEGDSSGSDGDSLSVSGSVRSRTDSVSSSASGISAPVGLTPAARKAFDEIAMDAPFSEEELQQMGFAQGVIDLALREFAGTSNGDAMLEWMFSNADLVAAEEDGICSTFEVLNKGSVEVIEIESEVAAPSPGRHPASGEELPRSCTDAATDQSGTECLNSNITKKELLFHFIRTMALLQESSRCSITTEGLTNAFGWSAGDVSVQQDVQELSRILIDALESQLKGSSQEKLIDRLYRGRIARTTTCLCCGFQSSVAEEFLDIQLLVNGFQSLEASLPAAFSEEILDGADAYLCEQCGKKTRASRRASLTHLPRILSFSLLRMDYDPKTWSRRKITSDFGFPFQLKFSRSSDGSGFYTGDDCEYELFSVIVHLGSAYGGHYHAYIRDLSVTDRLSFLNFDDSAVRRMDEPELCIDRRNAYILVYRDCRSVVRAGNVFAVPSYLRQQIEREKSVQLFAYGADSVVIEHDGRIRVQGSPRKIAVRKEDLLESSEYHFVKVYHGIAMFDDSTVPTDTVVQGDAKSFDCPLSLVVFKKAEEKSVVVARSTQTVGEVLQLCLGTSEGRLYLPSGKRSPLQETPLFRLNMKCDDTIFVEADSHPWIDQYVREEMSLLRITVAALGIEPDGTYSDNPSEGNGLLGVATCLVVPHRQIPLSISKHASVAELKRKTIDLLVPGRSHDIVFFGKVHLTRYRNMTIDLPFSLEDASLYTQGVETGDCVLLCPGIPPDPTIITLNFIGPHTMTDAAPWHIQLSSRRLIGDLRDVIRLRFGWSSEIEFRLRKTDLFGRPSSIIKDDDISLARSGLNDLDTVILEYGRTPGKGGTLLKLAWVVSACASTISSSFDPYVGDGLSLAAAGDIFVSHNATVRDVRSLVYDQFDSFVLPDSWKKPPSAGHIRLRLFDDGNVRLRGVLKPDSCPFRRFGLEDLALLGVEVLSEESNPHTSDVVVVVRKRLPAIASFGAATQIQVRPSSSQGTFGRHLSQLFQIPLEHLKVGRWLPFSSSFRLIDNSRDESLADGESFVIFDARDDPGGQDDVLAELCLRDKMSTKNSFASGGAIEPSLGIDGMLDWLSELTDDRREGAPADRSGSEKHKAKETGIRIKF